MSGRQGGKGENRSSSPSCYQSLQPCVLASLLTQSCLLRWPLFQSFCFGFFFLSFLCLFSSSVNVSSEASKGTKETSKGTRRRCGYQSRQPHSSNLLLVFFNFTLSKELPNSLAASIYDCLDVSRYQLHVKTRRPSRSSKKKHALFFS